MTHAGTIKVPMFGGPHDGRIITVANSTRLGTICVTPTRPRLGFADVRGRAISGLATYRYELVAVTTGQGDAILATGTAFVPADHAEHREHAFALVYAHMVRPRRHAHLARPNSTSSHDAHPHAPHALDSAAEGAAHPTPRIRPPMPRPRDHPNVVARRRHGRTTDTVCWLCSQRIDHTLRWPNRWSHSVDHIVPLTRGGTNHPSNLADAHLTCNTSRQAGRNEHHTSRPW